MVLAWIAAESLRWKTYVANRVSEIHETTQKHECHYVQSIDNPADVLSRGCTPTELKNNNLWWNGPSWLRNPHIKDEKLSSDTEKHTSSDVLVEEKVKSVVTTVIVGTSEMSIFIVEKVSTRRGIYITFLQQCISKKAKTDSK